MNPDIDLVERSIAFSPAEANAFLRLAAAHGTDERDGINTVKNLLVCWDDTDHTRLRAASYPENVVPVKLKDGRVLISGLWSKKALAAIQRAEVIAAELGKAELDPLLPSIVPPSTVEVVLSK